MISLSKIDNNTINSIKSLALDMINSAGRDGTKLFVCSGYRSYSYQKNLFEKQVEKTPNNIILKQKTYEYF